MPFTYQSNATAVLNALNGYNTTTAAVNLSGGLSTTVATIVLNDPEIVAVRKMDMPAIFVRIASKSEEFEDMGPPGPTGSFKRADVEYHIFAIYQREGMHTDHSTGVLQLYRMAQNIEGVFQAEHRLSGTALWCNPETTQFLDVLGEHAVFKTALITLKARYHFR